MTGYAFKVFHPYYPAPYVLPLLFVITYQFIRAR